MVSSVGRKSTIRLHQATRTTALRQQALWRNWAERNATEIHPGMNRNVADQFFLYGICLWLNSLSREQVNPYYGDYSQPRWAQKLLSIPGFHRICEWDFRRGLTQAPEECEGEAGRPCGGMERHLESLGTTAGMFIILCLLFWVCAFPLFLSLSPFFICAIKVL